MKAMLESLGLMLLQYVKQDWMKTIMTHEYIFNLILYIQQYGQI